MTTRKSVSSVGSGGQRHMSKPTYSPWVNGLVKGTNKLFLHILKHLCAPNLNNKDIERLSMDELPRTRPDRFDETIRILN